MRHALAGFFVAPFVLGCTGLPWTAENAGETVGRTERAKPYSAQIERMCESETAWRDRCRAELRDPEFYAMEGQAACADSPQWPTYWSEVIRLRRECVETLGCDHFPNDCDAIAIEQLRLRPEEDPLYVRCTQRSIDCEYTPLICSWVPLFHDAARAEVESCLEGWCDDESCVREECNDYIGCINGITL